MHALFRFRTAITKFRENGWLGTGGYQLYNQEAEAKIILAKLRYHFYLHKNLHKPFIAQLSSLCFFHISGLHNDQSITLLKNYC